MILNYYNFLRSDSVSESIYRVSKDAGVPARRYYGEMFESETLWLLEGELNVSLEEVRA